MKLFQKQKITKEMSVSEIIGANPLARQVLRKHDIRFIGRDASPLESLEKVAAANNLSADDVDKIVKELNDTGTVQGNIVELTGAAAAALKELLKAKGKKGIRLRLVSDGCGAYVYDMDFGTKRVGNEISFKSNGVTLFIDQKTVDFLRGTKIDYRKEKDGFLFDNPNVKA